MGNNILLSNTVILKSNQIKSNFIYPRIYMGGYHTSYVTCNIEVIKYVIQDKDVNT